MILQGLRPVHLLLFLPWLAALGWLVGSLWFLTDDAFISFRYARNLLEGHGLVFNPGERVEGYSNFLWVLELAALWGAFGLRPEQAAPWLSVFFTVATLTALLWWVARLPSLPHRGLVGWMALGLVCSSATFAMWTSGGGLETRQFTFFVVLPVVVLSLYRERRGALLLASSSLAAASLTRPEGPLFAACCFGWFVMQRRADTGRWLPEWGAAARLAGPCVTAVASHYLFRYAYYGEWLPNTYYAKHVRPWYEMGMRYLWTAGLETGLYLLLPLAALALVKRWRRGDLTYALPLLCIALHMGYVARIGGDHFEYRPLDFYWPLLAAPAAEGVVHVGLWASCALRRLRPLASLRPAALARACAVALFLPVSLYSSVIQTAMAFTGARMDKAGKSRVGWLLAFPGMPALAGRSEDARARMIAHHVGVVFVRHRGMSEMEIQRWGPYRDMERGVIPDDAMALTRPAGILPYFVPDLKFIDYHGLTDATIARNSVTAPNRDRRIAHDRSPPPGYLAERRVNFAVHPAAASVDEAFEYAVYAVQVGPDLWMPFDAPDLEWVEARFETFAYDAEADRRLEKALGNARLLIRGRFDVWLDGDRLLYVKDRCDVVDVLEDRFFLHVVPVDPDDLPERHKEHGFDKLDFNLNEARLNAAQRCAAARTLPDYPVAAIRTGQIRRAGMTRFRQPWEEEFRFLESGCQEPRRRMSTPGAGATPPAIAGLTASSTSEPETAMSRGDPGGSYVVARTGAAGSDTSTTCTANGG